MWFAVDESRPLAFLAGLWMRRTSVRKVEEGETTNDLFGFLTTEPKAEVKAIQPPRAPKAMPVILIELAEGPPWPLGAVQLRLLDPDGGEGYVEPASGPAERRAAASSP